MRHPIFLLPSFQHKIISELLRQNPELRHPQERSDNAERRKRRRRTKMNKKNKKTNEDEKRQQG